MNRYSLLFAVLVAVSFVSPAPRPGDAPHAAEPSAKARKANRVSGEQHPQDFGVDPSGSFDQFLSRRIEQPKAAALLPSVLFATVPHPTETHLAADFDENVAAIQQAIQDSGYTFDQAWIPWEFPLAYEEFEDNSLQKQAVEYQNQFPGILFFRKLSPRKVSSGSLPDTYGQGLIVFLIAEKPTAGLAVTQVDEALKFLKKYQIPLTSPIRIAGPTYSGSVASLEPVLRLLHAANNDADFLIRSGGASGGSLFVEKIASIAAQMPNIKIDFGSANHTWVQWEEAALFQLSRIGIDPQHTAFLNEDESEYGSLPQSPNEAKLLQPSSPDHAWELPYPRDISALRAGYQSQGVLDSSSPGQLWKRYLNLKSDAQGQGDSVRSFGADDTVTAQESILFGISSFLKTHGIRAIVISATNPEDNYFLSQFFHANNSGLRIVSIGSSRLFLRGNTAQFRGDMVIDNFPMLPRLYDWNTGTAGVERIFYSDYAQGEYFAAIDLLASPDFPGNAYHLYPEYAAPDWSADRPPQRPPLYVSSLGGGAAWPVNMVNYEPLSIGTFSPCSDDEVELPPVDMRAGAWRVEMPSLLFGHNCGTVASEAPRGSGPKLGSYWTYLFVFLWVAVACYSCCFFYSNPLTRRLCASFDPVVTWRYWLFTVTIPAVLAGCAFQVLAAPVNVPASIRGVLPFWWWCAIGSSLLAPLAISTSALRKAAQRQSSASSASRNIALILPVCLLLLFACTHLWSFCGRPTAADTGLILNMFREMHWESGLSLVPTWLLALFAIFLWARQASQATAVFHIPPQLPDFPDDQRISSQAAIQLQQTALPWSLNSHSRWLWKAWLSVSLFMFTVVVAFPPFRSVSTLEPLAVTRSLLYVVTAVASLLLMDLLQFLALWYELRALLRALATYPFRRSFIPINDFKWPNFWSFGGVAFADQRAILAAMIDHVLVLRDAGAALGASQTASFAKIANALETMRLKYRRAQPVPRPSLNPVDQYREDLKVVYTQLAEAASTAASLVMRNDYPQPYRFSESFEARQRALTCNCDNRSRFNDESEDAIRLLGWQKAAEQLLCLAYINYIQSVIARLHGLMLSVAGVFSVIALAVAIYPFSPVSPFVLSGFVLLPLLAWAFFHVFSQMDTDPILSRIVNGDDRKLQWNFYGKYAESLALPILTLVSSVLPGGAGRFLEIAQKLLEHGQ